MSVEFLRVTHASRVLASASSGLMEISILLPIVVRPPPKRTVRLNTCAPFFAGFVRCIVNFLSDQQ